MKSLPSVSAFPSRVIPLITPSFIAAVTVRSVVSALSKLSLSLAIVLTLFFAVIFAACFMISCLVLSVSVPSGP